MTQQQIVQEFKSYPKAKKSVVIRQLLRIFEEDLEEKATTSNGDESATEERRQVVDRLRVIAETNALNSLFSRRTKISSAFEKKG